MPCCDYIAGMTNEQFRALRTLILDQNVKIESLAMEIRALKTLVTSPPDVIYVTDEDVAEEADMPEDVKKLLGL
jgi:hypothetical protein